MNGMYVKFDNRKQQKMNKFSINNSPDHDLQQVEFEISHEKKGSLKAKEMFNKMPKLEVR